MIQATNFCTAGSSSRASIVEKFLASWEFAKIAWIWSWQTFLAALALRDQMVDVDLVARNDALAERAKHRLRSRFSFIEYIAILAGHRSVFPRAGQVLAKCRYLR